jgi:hypothetical protein
MGDRPAICFGCAGSFAHEALKEVGDALFCGSCFARLMAPVADRAPLEPIVTAPRPPAKTPPFTTLGHCFLCSGPVGADAFVSLREFMICRSCSEELTRDLQPAEAGVPTPEAVVERAPAAARPVVTPGTGTEICAGCGRLMPGPGSYRLIDGQPYCPACAPFAPTADGQRRRPTPTPPPTPEPVPVATPLCDCCVRPLAGDQFRALGGFWLCLACLGSDETLALAIARARYRRRLARLRANLGEP